MRSFAPFIARSGAIVLAATLALPLASLWHAEGVAAWFPWSLAGLWVLSATQAWLGAATLSGAIPLALGVAQAAGGLTSAGATECLVLAFASGATASLVTGRPSRPLWLAGPALVLGAAVTASVAVDLAGVAAIAPARPYLPELWQHVLRGYWGPMAGEYPSLHIGVRWIAGLTLAVLVERSLAERRDARRIVTWLWLSAAGAAITFTIVRIVEIVHTRDDSPASAVLWLLANTRISVLHPDQNAAGSCFGMLIAAAVVVGLGRRLWWMLFGVVPLLVVGMAFAQSRAAIGAFILVLGARWLVARHANRWAAYSAVLAFVIAAGAAAAWMSSSRSHIDAATAITIRADMTRVGLRMAERFWDFGVGLGDYARTSRRFITPEFPALAGYAQQGENAHNNFLQVLVELGAPAFLAFLLLIVPLVAAGWLRRPVPSTPEHEALVLGLSVFLVSAMFGHPLLITEVSAMFLFALGLLASHRAPGTTTPAWITGVTLAGTAFFLASLLWRWP